MFWNAHGADAWNSITFAFSHTPYPRVFTHASQTGRRGGTRYCAGSLTIPVCTRTFSPTSAYLQAALTRVPALDYLTCRHLDVFRLDFLSLPAATCRIAFLTAAAPSAAPFLRVGVLVPFLHGRNALRCAYPATRERLSSCHSTHHYTFRAARMRLLTLLPRTRRTFSTALRCRANANISCAMPRPLRAAAGPCLRCLHCLDMGGIHLTFMAHNFATFCTCAFCALFTGIARTLPATPHGCTASQFIHTTSSSTFLPRCARLPHDARSSQLDIGAPACHTPPAHFSFLCRAVCTACHTACGCAAPHTRAFHHGTHCGWHVTPGLPASQPLPLSGYMGQPRCCTHTPRTLPRTRAHLLLFVRVWVCRNTRRTLRFSFCFHHCGHRCAARLRRGCYCGTRCAFFRARPFSPRACLFAFV